MASPNWDDSQRDRVLVECFSEFKKAREAQGTLTGRTWFAAYFGRYLDRARDKLEPGDQKKLDAARARIATP